MRVLSPRMLPPVSGLVGSTASTATFLPVSIKLQPNASMKVLLPTPGTPVMPVRKAFPECGKSLRLSSAASFWCFGLRLSISVMARPSIAGSPESTPATKSSTLGGR